MSGSLPLFRPALSERLRLCPIPPRLGSGAQSPVRSGTFDGAACWLAGAACATGRNAVKAFRDTKPSPRIAATMSTATSAVADATRRFRMSCLRPGRRLPRRQLFAVGEHDPLQVPDRGAVARLEDVNRDLV